MKVAQNGSADALPCLHKNASHAELNVITDIKELAAVQENDTEIVRLNRLFFITHTQRHSITDV